MQAQAGYEAHGPSLDCRVRVSVSSSFASFEASLVAAATLSWS